MKKLILGLTVLLAGSTGFAAINSINSAVMKGFHTHIASTQSKNPISIIYGGQDISEPKVAIANETLWSGEPTRIVL